MRFLHNKGFSYCKIAPMFNVNHTTVRRHCDEKARNQMDKYSRSEIGRRRELLRIKVVEKLGGKCIKCGVDDIRVLQLDHINGGGNKERRKGIEAYTVYKRALLVGEKEFQILCANCNRLKAIENNEYRRKYDKQGNPLGRI